ncbi:MAG: ABC transporter permease [Dermatophilaceae bacterium]
MTGELGALARPAATGSGAGGRLADPTMAARLRGFLRVLFVGGLTSFRALFGWLSPVVYIPSLIVSPVFQILLFAYIGRRAGVQSDAFYLVGNAVQYSAIPCLFAMANTIAGERGTQTLGIVLVSPANRLALFFGRALPVVVNGWFATLVSLAAGAWLLGVSIPAGQWPGLAVAVAAGAASCTGLGLVEAAIAMRVRSTAVLSNLLFGLLLVFSGANIALDALPGWMAALSSWLPLTHAIEASRDLAAGGSLSSVGGLLGQEMALGTAYAAFGLVALRLLELDGRRRATLELR